MFVAVLIAFGRVLHENYPDVNRHFIDQTHADIGAEAPSLAGPDRNRGQKFKEFVTFYNAEPAKLAGKRLSGEEVSNAVRPRRSGSRRSDVA